ncbi:MAG: N-acetyltransferase, partial [Solirubrobacteraceae bacterium]
AEIFLAWRSDGAATAGNGERSRPRVVGRISAHIDHSYNEYHGARWGWFGFLEVEEDQEALAALLDAAADWLRERGCERMVGPADLTMNDESGILVEGFEEPVMIREPWHPPYYQQLVEGAEMQKAMDLFVWSIDVGDRADALPILFELADKVQSEHGIRLRRMSRLHLRRELEHFGELYNATWAKNWGFVPYDKDDLDFMAQDMQLVFDRNWFMVAEREDTREVVGLAITIPDINQVAAKMKGRILPLGWWHFLRRAHITDRMRIGFLGVKPEYQHTGVAAKLYVEHFDMAARRPQTWAHCGWILETNEPMNRAMEAMGAKVVKRYRMYERELAP